MHQGLAIQARTQSHRFSTRFIKQEALQKHRASSRVDLPHHLMAIRSYPQDQAHPVPQDLGFPSEQPSQLGTQINHSIAARRREAALPQNSYKNRYIYLAKHLQTPKTPLIYIYIYINIYTYIYIYTHIYIYIYIPISIYTYDEM